MSEFEETKICDWCNEEYDPRIDDAVKQLATILTENYFTNM